MNENSHNTWSGVSLSAKRGEKLVFSNLEFNLISGDALLLKGSNGFGKSTLLRLMAGLGHPQSGYLLVEFGKYKNRSNSSFRTFKLYRAPHRCEISIER